MHSHEGTLLKAALYDRFASKKILTDRVKGLQVSGYLAADGALLFVTQRGRRLIFPFVLLKSAWRLGPGG